MGYDKDKLCGVNVNNFSHLTCMYDWFPAQMLKLNIITGMVKSFLKLIVYDFIK